MSSQDVAAYHECFAPALMPLLLPRITAWATHPVLTGIVMRPEKHGAEVERELQTVGPSGIAASSVQL